jgi:hypothetical protein
MKKLLSLSFILVFLLVSSCSNISNKYKINQVEKQEEEFGIVSKVIFYSSLVFLASSLTILLINKVNPTVGWIFAFMMLGPFIIMFVGGNN